MSTLRDVTSRNASGEILAIAGVALVVVGALMMTASIAQSAPGLATYGGMVLLCLGAVFELVGYLALR